MKKIGLLLLLGMFAATPALAQEETYDDSGADEQFEAVADDAVAADDLAVSEEEIPADDAAVEEVASEEVVAEEVVEETVAADEPVMEETVAADEPVAEETAVSDREPWELYVGADHAWLRASFSDTALKNKFGGDEFESTFYRIRAGVRLFGAVGVEAHYGIKDEDDTESGTIEVGDYWGVFVVPTGTLFNFIELAAPIGYSRTQLQRGNAKETFDGLSFGLNFEIPLLIDVSWFPDLRIGGGGTVYQAENDSRVYGYHAGIRIDFKL